MEHQSSLNKYDVLLENTNLYLGKPSNKKNGKKKGTLSTRGGGGSTPVPFFSPNLPKFTGSSNHPEINSRHLGNTIFVIFFVIF